MNIIFTIIFGVVSLLGYFIFIFCLTRERNTKETTSQNYIIEEDIVRANMEERKRIKRENEKLQITLNKCEAKIEEIKEIIEDFNYSDKKTYEELCLKYEKSCSKIKKDLKNANRRILQVIIRINNLIEKVNQTYKNAYYRKNNVSSLSYIIETNEDIDLIEEINIIEFIHL